MSLNETIKTTSAIKCWDIEELACSSYYRIYKRLKQLKQQYCLKAYHYREIAEMLYCSEFDKINDYLKQVKKRKTNAQ